MSANKRFEDLVFDVISKHDSATDADVARDMPRLSVEERALAINALLNGHRIQLVGTDFENPRYKALAPEEAQKTKGLSLEDMLVYQVIIQAGNTGIWTRDMKARTNLAQTKITKTLRALEERGLIKAVKSVQNASRKVYMLASLEPAKEITGGPWYGADQQPDREFIDAIRKVAQLYVESRASKGQLASVEEVADTIASSGVSNQVLQTDDVDGISKTLVYDSHLEMFEVGDPPVTKYGAAKVTVPDGVPFTDCPCGVCPVFNDCHEGGPVAPERCDYYKKWLGELEF